MPKKLIKEKDLLKRTLKSSKNEAVDNKNEVEKVVDISKKKVVSGEVASKFVRGADLRTVNLVDMYAALRLKPVNGEMFVCNSTVRDTRFYLSGRQCTISANDHKCLRCSLYLRGSSVENCVTHGKYN